MPSVSPPQIAAFRAFNRFYTRFIGVLNDQLLHSGYSLAEARVLYELANGSEVTAKEIVGALGMDAAYLSRILARFESDKLLRRAPSSADARLLKLSLTAKGRRSFSKLNKLSENQAREVLAGLPPQPQARLLDSMSTIESILNPGAETRPNFILRPPCPGDMGTVVSREGALYAQEYGFEETFEALVARIVADFIDNCDPRRERCWIAEVHGEHAGHIFLVRHPDDPTTARLRLLLVEPSARGMKLGSTLVAECVNFARSAGYKKITLWTQSILHSARRIYQNAGFRLASEQANHQFGQDLISQTWVLDLTVPRNG
jgi:DNA-binding MarR family transcriptional regulator/GNAT superfamily N-acetyltransferase